jgi:hypothetical protein
VRQSLTATKYLVDGSAVEGRPVYQGIYLERRGFPPHPETWAISDGVFVLNTDMEWEHEPMPSSRTEDFLSRTRFTFGEARVLVGKFLEQRKL